MNCIKNLYESNYIRTAENHPASQSSMTLSNGQNVGPLSSNLAAPLTAHSTQQNHASMPSMLPMYQQNTGGYSLLSASTQAVGQFGYTPSPYEVLLSNVSVPFSTQLAYIESISSLLTQQNLSLAYPSINNTTLGFRQNIEGYCAPVPQNYAVTLSALPETPVVPSQQTEYEKLRQLKVSGQTSNACSDHITFKSNIPTSDLVLLNNYGENVIQQNAFKIASIENDMEISVEKSNDIVLYSPIKKFISTRQAKKRIVYISKKITNDRIQEELLFSYNNNYENTIKYIKKNVNELKNRKKDESLQKDIVLFYIHNEKNKSDFNMEKFLSQFDLNSIPKRSYVREILSGICKKIQQKNNNFSKAKISSGNINSAIISRIKRKKIDDLQNKIINIPFKDVGQYLKEKGIPEKISGLKDILKLYHPRFIDWEVVLLFFLHKWKGSSEVFLDQFKNIEKGLPRRETMRFYINKMQEKKSIYIEKYIRQLSA